MTQTIQPPSSAGVLREAKGRSRAAAPVDALARAGLGTVDGRGLPGYGAGDVSTLVLSNYLRLLGYDARGWTLGRNFGNVCKLFPRIVAGLEAVAAETTSPVRLIRWSLGGYRARSGA
jgi:hypothetical protein